MIARPMLSNLSYLKVGIVGTVGTVGLGLTITISQAHPATLFEQPF